MKKIFVVFVIILVGCGGRTNKKQQLAQNFFKQASIEISNYQEKNDTNALRKALNDIDQSLANDETPQSQGLKASILFQLGKLAESKELFERVLQNKTISKAKHADTVNNYAIVLYQLGQKNEAETLWHSLINNEHYTSPELAHFNLGYAQFNEAVQLLAQRPSTQPQQIPAPAIACLEAAIEHFKNALAISKEYINAFFFMGQAYIALGNLEEARNCYQTILTLDPDHQAAAQVLRYVEEQLVNHHQPV
jgi:Tfp pilus assembly protein PilF